MLARDDSEVIVPDVIDLTSFFREQQEREVKYQLVAIVNHMGNMRAGHYTAFGKREGKWIYFNDATVIERNPPMDASSAAYLVCYSRIEEEN
jgi:ubiquitin C-terminal hydrolase